MAVTVRVTETYDMKTTVGKMGIIGIHTPDGSLIQKLYPGLVKNHKFIRFKKCDVVGACASVLPADPLQVGVSAGEVAPEDMFNPILYKACTNTSFDEIVNRIYASYSNHVIDATASVQAETVPFPDANSFTVYYSLLAENGRFRKSMPQRGFMIRNLRPIAHTLVSSFGNLNYPSNADLVDEETNGYGVPVNLSDVIVPKQSAIDDTTLNSIALTYRGRSVPMPRMPLHYGPEAYNALPNSLHLPKTYVACMIIPPAKLYEFYYRMRVTWTVRFEELMTANEVANFASMGLISSASHGTNYTYEESKTSLQNSESSVDADDVEINKIMES